MTTKSLFAGLLVVAVLAVPGATAVYSAPACAAFELVPGPNVDDLAEGGLTAVSAARDGSAWAVGSLRTGGSTFSTLPRPYVARLIEGAWKIEQTPDLSHLVQPVFEGISAGQATTQLGSPVPTNQLSGPVAEAWVVGHHLDKPSSLAVPLILALQNGFWRQMEITLASDLKGVMLRDVVALGRNRALAVGEQFVPQTARTLPFVAGFDGRQWTELGIAGGVGRLVAVAQDGAGKAWAVGHETLSSTALPEVTVAQIALFDGKTWSTMKHPARRPGTSLLDVVALAADDVWAVGFDGASGLFLHWNGAEWSEHAGPAGALPLSVAGVSGKDVWAVGRTEYYHFDGQSWMALPATNKPAESARRAVAVAGPCAVWAVGTLLDGGRELPLVERAVGSAVPDVPAPPVGLLASVVADDKATLEWQHAGGATAFLVERCDDEAVGCDLASDGRYNVLVKVAPSGKGGTYTDAGLKPDTYFSYRVRAANGAGESEPSASVTIRTPSAVPSSTEVEAIPALPTPGPVVADTVQPEPPVVADTVPPAPPVVADTVEPAPPIVADTVPAAAPAPTRAHTVIAATLVAPDARCQAVAAEINVLGDSSLRGGSKRLEVVFKDALGSDAGARCLPVKWTVLDAGKVTLKSNLDRFATVSGAPGRYAIRALAPNGVSAETIVIID